MAEYSRGAEGYENAHAGVADDRPLSYEMFTEPRPELVDRALSQLADPQHRRLFYGRLDNPRWIRPLAERGVFRSPPGVLVDEDGSVRALPWPEGEYLARMAALAPQDVAAALHDSSASENIFVQRSVVEAATKLPERLAAKFVPAIADYVERSYSDWLDPRDLAALAARLLLGGELGAGRKLAAALYQPRVKGTQEGVLGPRPVIGGAISDYWYQDTIRTVAMALVRAQGLDGLRILVGWLEDWQKLSEYYDGSTGLDISYSWRPSVAPHEQNSDFSDVGDALVDGVREGARAVSAPDMAIVEVLERSPQPLLHRIALDVLTERSTRDRDSTILAAAKTRLMDAALLDIWSRHEYVALARVVLPLLTDAERSRWRAAIEAAPGMSDDDIKRVVAWQEREPETVTASEVAEYRERWARDLLEAIGREALPEDLATWLDSLSSRHGPPRDHADFPAWSESFVGPDSPLETAELQELQVDELIRMLREWEPDPSRLGPSREGLGRRLAEVVKSDPVAIAERAVDLEGLDPTYVRGVISGFEQAVTEGRRLPWHFVLHLLEWVARQPDDGSEPAYDLDRDPGWRWTQRSTGSLLATALRAAPETAPATDEAMKVWRSLAGLAKSPDPTPSHEARYGGSNMDPLTLSLNTVRPVALRAIVRFLEWLDRSGAREPGLEQSAYSALDTHIGTAADPSLAVQAVFGEAIGTLLRLRRDWVMVRLERLLGDPTGQEASPGRAGFDTVWSTMLAVYRPSKLLVDDLQPYFRQQVHEISSAREGTVGWATQRSPRQHLADHLLTLYVQGHLSFEAPNGLVRELFRSAEPELLGDALGHLGWQLFGSDEVDPQVVERARLLWEWRAHAVDEGSAQPGELTGFLWWARSGKFEPAWWLRMLLQAARVSELDTAIGAGELLAEVAASGHAAGAFDVFSLLIGRLDRWEAYDLIRHAPTIIACALASGDPNRADRSRQLMHELGRRGELDLQARVDAEIERLRGGGTHIDSMD